MARSFLAMFLLAVAVIGYASMVCAAESRTWTDKTGKFSVEAELLAIEEGNVKLRTSDGKKIEVPVEKLSESDKVYLKVWTKRNSPDEGSTETLESPQLALKESATRFLKDLRTESREKAKAMLTAKGQEVAESGKSPLEFLPKLGSSDTSIRVGKVEINDSQASVQANVRVGKVSQKIKLHFRLVESDWKVYAVSATLPDGEKTLDFEKSPASVPQNPLQAMVGKTLQFEGISADGKKFDLADYKGKVVLIDFWATWCAGCMQEMPNIKSAYEKYNKKGFEVVAVSVDQDMNVLQEYLSKENPPWKVVADKHPKAKKSIGAQCHVSSLPTFILIDRDGKVAVINCRGSQLAPAIKKLL